MWQPSRQAQIGRSVWGDRGRAGCGFLELTVMSWVCCQSAADAEPVSAARVAAAPPTHTQHLQPFHTLRPLNDCWWHLLPLKFAPLIQTLYFFVLWNPSPASGTEWDSPQGDSTSCRWLTAVSREGHPLTAVSSPTLARNDLCVVAAALQTLKLLIEIVHVSNALRKANVG